MFRNLANLVWVHFNTSGGKKGFTQMLRADIRLLLVEGFCLLVFLFVWVICLSVVLAFVGRDGEEAK